MRQDMAKVIVERPRWGSSLPSQKKGYLKVLQRVPVDELPRREPMLGRWHGMQRSLNENLAPLARFLRSNLGRPWNKVHQELCEHVSFDNAVQKHVLAHVGQYVMEHVECRKGRLFALDGWGRRRELSVGQMYVCPETGLLRILRPTRRRHLLTQVPIALNQDGNFCVQRDGIGMHSGCAPFPRTAARVGTSGSIGSLPSMTRRSGTKPMAMAHSRFR